MSTLETEKGKKVFLGETAGQANVLVLDDDPALRELFSIMIERIGCKANLFSSSAQAIKAYESAGTNTPVFDCALIDLNIDEQLDGVAVARILREINPFVRLVLVSGSINPKALEAHLGLGFDAVIPKPFSLKQLREAVMPQN